MPSGGDPETDLGHEVHLFLALSSWHYLWKDKGLRNRISTEARKKIEVKAEPLPWDHGHHFMAE